MKTSRSDIDGTHLSIKNEATYQLRKRIDKTEISGILNHPNTSTSVWFWTGFRARTLLPKYSPSWWFGQKFSYWFSIQPMAFVRFGARVPSMNAAAENNSWAENGRRENVRKWLHLNAKLQLAENNKSAAGMFVRLMTNRIPFHYFAVAAAADWMKV